MKILFFLSLLSFFVAACTSDREDVGGTCGTIRNNELLENIDQELGVPVFLSFSTQGAILTVIEEENMRILIAKIAGITLQDNERQAQAVADFVTENSRGARYFETERDCLTNSTNFSDLRVVQIYLANGRSLAEELLIRGLVQPDRSGECNSLLLSNCYQALAVEASR